jgi:hypothetical protein
VDASFEYDPRMDGSVSDEMIKNYRVALPEASNEAREAKYNYVLGELGVAPPRTRENAKKLAQLRRLDELQRMYQLSSTRSLREAEVSQRSLRSRENKALAFLRGLE